MYIVSWTKSIVCSIMDKKAYDIGRNINNDVRGVALSGQSMCRRYFNGIASLTRPT